MKKPILILLSFCLIMAIPATAQKGGLLKKVANSMTNELLGKPENPNQGPEPTCECDQPVLVMNMGGKLKLDYKELSISITDDGRILAKHVGSDEYYVVKDGVTQGPYKSGDPRIKGFDIVNDEVPEGADQWVFKYKEYISKQGEEYLITFGGKTYGPYALIQNFVVTRSKEKFAAIVTEDLLITRDLAKRMEEAMKNAKTDQEKMDISMQYAQEMSNNMGQGNKKLDINPKLVTNVPGATYDPMETIGGNLNSKMKYDEILVSVYDKVLDLQSKTLLTVRTDILGIGDLFINTTNTKYAAQGYGNLTFSDNTKLAGLFNPMLIKVDGKIYLAYMYYSPKKNSIMQCKIPF